MWGIEVSPRRSPASSSPAAGGWRTIESAPYTFTNIPGLTAEDQKWLDWQLVGKFQDDPDRFVSWVAGMDAGIWLGRDEHGACWQCEAPTHWQPISSPPPAPVSGEEG
jgi:hypothetical protein